ncbi:MAG: tRNA pseudouridine(38-40) synthase TruA [Bacilli bacterium]|nr:tRNA pseudouridine(38-40) synthase TruA [Bacilli bacterium]
MKILGVCSYKGTNYYGWQKQVGFISVQEKIEECLSKVYDSPINIQGSGRTDAGVHALKQYFHFVSEKEKDLKQLAYALNKMLPNDIKIISFTKVDDDFHARYNAKRKIYEYRILLTNKDPLSYDLAYIYPMELNIELFKEALNRFVGTHNYQDFTSKEEDEANFVRTIYSIDLIKENDLLRVVFNGNGFMRYQIRNMIGSAINVANGKESLSFIDNHLKEDKTKREIIAYKAPASGLYLVDVIYN